MIGAMLTPDGGFTAIISVSFADALNREIARQTQLLLEWHRLSVPEDLWTQVDDLYAVKNVTPFLIHVIAGSWFCAPLRPYLTPQINSVDGMLTWYSNARLFQPYWGAFGPLVAGILSTITVSPITINNMMLTLPIYFTASMTSFMYFICEFLWIVIENMAEYLKGITDATLEQVTGHFQDLVENAENIF
jgi:hypothetical protein